MTETTQTQCTAGGPTVYVAFELGSSKWMLAFTTTAAQRPRLRQIPAGDLGALEREVASAKARFGVPTARVRSCYEAGRDGFWLHRWLVAHGVDNRVVDASSIEVNRRARRAKSDRLDVGKLLQQLLRWAAGERKVWSIVAVPSPQAEAARQVTREIATVQADRLRSRNRLTGLLATQGIRVPLTRRFGARIATLMTGDGRPLDGAWQARLLREWAHLQTIERRLATVYGARRAETHTPTTRVGAIAQQLTRLKGIAEASAALYSAELFGTRTFQNGRQIGALTGLAPVPYRSDQRVQDQGISKAGRADLRRVSIQIAWCWLRWQPDSDLARWFTRRFAAAGARSRRIGIVAVARKLVIALWRFSAHGVLPAGAHLKGMA